MGSISPVNLTEGSPPDASAGRGRAFHWCVLIFAMIFPTIMAWIYFVVLAKPPSEDRNGSAIPANANYAVLIAYSLGKIVQTGLPLVWVWYFERHRLQLVAPSFRGLGLALAFGFVVAIGVVLFYFAILRDSPLLAGTPEMVREKVGEFHAATPIRYLLLAVFIAGAHSLMEEYYWRWFLFGELRRQLAVPAAITLSSLAFMLHHVIILKVYLPNGFGIGVIPFSLCVAFGGGVWAWLYQRTGTIYSAWLSHLLVDAAILVAGYDMVFVHLK